MEKSAIIITIFSSTISGILGVVISNWYYSKQQKKQLKLNLVKNILGYSYQITNEYNGSMDDIVKYLNQIYIIFNSSEEVVKALTDFKISTNNRDDKLLTLLKKMCDDVGIDYKNINDSFLSKPFISRT